MDIVQQPLQITIVALLKGIVHTQTLSNVSFVFHTPRN